MGGVLANYNSRGDNNSQNCSLAQYNNNNGINGNIEANGNYTWQKICIKITDRIKFTKNTYREDLLKYIIKQNEYDKIIAKGDKVLYSCWSKKKEYEKINIPIFIYIFFILLVILSILQITLVIVARDHENGLLIGKLSFALAFLIMLGTIILALYNFLKKPTHDKTFRAYFLESLPKFCDGINKEISKNIRFYYDNQAAALVCEFKIINLHKDVQKAKDNTKNNMYEEESNYCSKTTTQDEPHLETKVQIHQSDIHSNPFGKC